MLCIGTRSPLSPWAVPPPPPVLGTRTVEIIMRRFQLVIVTKALRCEPKGEVSASQGLVVVLLLSLCTRVSLHTFKGSGFWVLGVPGSQHLYSLAPTAQFNSASWPSCPTTHLGDSRWVSHCSRICVQEEHSSSRMVEKTVRDWSSSCFHTHFIAKMSLCS